MACRTKSAKSVMVRVRRREAEEEEEEDDGDDNEGEEGAVAAPAISAAPSFSSSPSVSFSSTVGRGGVRALRIPRLVDNAVAAAPAPKTGWSLTPLLMLLRRRRVVTMLALAFNLTEK